jgi:hypothetical protein
MLYLFRILKKIKMKKYLKYVVIAVIVLIVIGALSGGKDELVKEEMQKIENQVAEDAVKQYNIAKENGNAMDAYVQAGMVKAAYLQANDTENFKKWTAIEAEESKNVGLTK